MIVRYSPSLLAAWLCVLGRVIPVQALWPFPARQSTVEALNDLGSLGLEGVGRVVATGDWNGDQQYVLRNTHRQLCHEECAEI